MFNQFSSAPPSLFAGREMIAQTGCWSQQPPWPAGQPASRPTAFGDSRRVMSPGGQCSQHERRWRADLIAHNHREVAFDLPVRRAGRMGAN
jgi:hypothetical protein